MQTSGSLFLSSDITNEEEPLYISKTPAALLHDFKVAIGLLVFVSTIVMVVMHLFVPGL
jgi:hypothetical protein